VAGWFADRQSTSHQAFYLQKLTKTLSSDNTIAGQPALMEAKK
jgi:hypothetical protein